MGKKNFKRSRKPKENIVVDDQNVNLPFEGEDEFNIEDMIEEINPNDVVIVESSGNKKRRYEKIKDLKAKEADNGPKKKKNKKDEQLKTSETDEEKSDKSDVEEDKSDKKKPGGAKEKKKKRRRSKKADKKTEADAANKDKEQKSEKVEKAEEEKGDNIKQNGKNEESIENEKVEKDKFDENDVSEKPKSGKKPGVVDPSTLNLDMSAWDEFYLPNQVMDGLRKMRYTKPTEIQEKVLPEAITKRFDILGAAETGSGKTMAFCIPIAVRLLENEEKKGLRSLILAPTRELVMQIYKEMQRLLEFTPFNVIPVIGGINEQKQERLLKWNPEVIVATPGRFWALCESNAFLKSFASLEIMVIDEMDRMAETGHFAEMESILYRAHAVENKNLQTMVFSATLSFVHLPEKRPGKKSQKMTKEDKIEKLVKIGGLKEKYKVIDINPDVSTPKTLTEARVDCNDLLDKDSKLYYLLKRHNGRTLVFTNSIDASKRLANLLRTLQFTPTPEVLHAKMQQRARLKHLERFASTDNSVLIATDVAARGLDIKGVQNVIHYQVPRTAENYIHRSGRTARISNEGIAILMVDPKEVQLYRKLCSNLHRERDFPAFYIDSDKLYQQCNDRVYTATTVEKLDFRLSKYCSAESMNQKLADEMEIELDGRTEEDIEEITSLKRQRKAASNALKALLRETLIGGKSSGSMISLPSANKAIGKKKKVHLWKKK